DDPSQIFVFDTTGVDGSLNIAGSNLTFRAAVGPLGVFITGGTLDLHGTLTGGKLFKAGLGGSNFVNGRLKISDIDFSEDFSAMVGGHAEVHLPVYFPTDSIKAGTVHFLADLAFDSGTGEVTATAMPTATDKDGNPIGLAQLFTFDPSQIGLLNKLLLGVDGLDLFLEGLQDLLDGEVFGFKLPLIGSQLSGVGDVIANFRTG